MQCTAGRGAGHAAEHATSRRGRERCPAAQAAAALQVGMAHETAALAEQVMHLEHLPMAAQIPALVQ